MTRFAALATAVLVSLACACNAEESDHKPKGPSLATSGDTPSRTAGTGSATGAMSSGTGGATGAPSSGTGGATAPTSGTGGATAPTSGTGGDTEGSSSGTGGDTAPTGTGGTAGGGSTTFAVGACQIVMFAMCNREYACTNTPLAGIAECENRRRTAYRCSEVTALNPEIDDCKLAVAKSTTCPFVEPAICKKAFQY
jgi:hypothetical protein